MDEPEDFSRSEEVEKVLTGITGVLEGGLAFQANVEETIEEVRELFSVGGYVTLTTAESGGCVIINPRKILFLKLGKQMMIGGRIVAAPANTKIPDIGRH